ncbi:MAG: Peptidase family [Planctomycetaceae bacterium]|nr:Peptidase family [Planctomycetaceae bacterium]
MAVPEILLKRIAWHEAAHAFIAAYHGFQLLAVRIDGPENQEGSVWKVAPRKASAVFTQSQSQRELAVHAAGEVAESMWFAPPYDRDAGLDRNSCWRFALEMKGSPTDINQSHRLDIADWPKLACGRQLRDTIDTEKAAVRKILERHKTTIEPIANRLLEKRRVWGDEVIEIIDQIKAIQIQASEAKALKKEAN